MRYFNIIGPREVSAVRYARMRAETLIYPDRDAWLKRATVNIGAGQHGTYTYGFLDGQLRRPYTRERNGALSRKLRHNTYARLFPCVDDSCKDTPGPCECVAIRYHATAILEYHVDGRVIINVRGWTTHSTRERISEYSPIRVFSHLGEWLFAAKSHGWSSRDRTMVRYADGMTIDTNTGAVTGHGGIVHLTAKGNLPRDWRRYDCHHGDHSRCYYSYGRHEYMHYCNCHVCKKARG